MAKLTKGMLKGIVKECLVELLAEGLASSGPALKTEVAAPKNRQQQRKKSIFDQMDQSFAGKKTISSFETAVSNAARVATDDPILREMLADTAKTTLQEQLQHEPMNHSQPGFPSPEMSSDIINDMSVGPAAGAGLDIDSLFGELTSNWSEVLERSTTKKLP